MSFLLFKTVRADPCLSPNWKDFDPYFFNPPPIMILIFTVNIGISTIWSSVHFFNSFFPPHKMDTFNWSIFKFAFFFFFFFCLLKFSWFLLVNFLFQLNFNSRNSIWLFFKNDLYLFFNILYMVRHHFNISCFFTHGFLKSLNIFKQLFKACVE